MQQSNDTKQEKDLCDATQTDEFAWQDEEAPAKRQIPVVPIVICALLMAACVWLLFANRVTIAAGAKALFDTRPDLTEVSMFETMTTTPIESVTVWAQSADYSGYTETKTITDADAIAQLTKGIFAAKLVMPEEGATTPPAPEFDASTADAYHVTLADQTITFYTKANDASMLFIDGAWQEIDPVSQPSFYDWYLSSATVATIYDTNGLVYYPQEWAPTATEQATPSFGIDVSYHQGVIDWEQVAQDGVDFAFVRVGVRYAVSGVVEEDVLARYNLQEATKHGIAVGVYFFSTATTEAEVLEEAAMTLDIISGYGITYPVVYDCEMFHDAGNRNSTLTAAERSTLAEVFLTAIEDAGYTGMFYGSKNDLTANAAWETNYLQSKYRIWVAQYPGHENGATPQGISSYTGRHEIWQYTAAATVAGIAGGVDRNVAYFSYSALEAPKGSAAAEVTVDYDALAKMEETGDSVTAKEYANVRSAMDHTNDSNIMGQLHHGDIVTRISVGGNGWSKIAFNGAEGYVLTGLLTTEIEDLSKTPDKPDDFTTAFDEVNEQVTAKEVTNLRNMPSITDPASAVVMALFHGDVATRTGVSAEGFSRVEYQGQTLYCVSSYLEVIG